MAQTITAGGKKYLISPHAWRNIRRFDIAKTDLVRIIENPRDSERFRHKIVYLGCFVPNWTAEKGKPKIHGVKIVIDTRSKLRVKTVHITDEVNCEDHI